VFPLQTFACFVSACVSKTIHLQPVAAATISFA